MSLQPIVKPLLDFTVKDIKVPAPGPNEHGRMYVALVDYEWRGQTYQAHYEYHAATCSLLISTQGETIEFPTSQLLGNLLARISIGGHHAQAH